MQNDNLRATAAKELDKIKASADAGNIRDDLKNLKEDAASLLHNSKETGKEQLAACEAKAKDLYKGAKEKSHDYMAEVEAYVQNRPAQSLAFAFVGGLIASMIFKSRR